MKPLFRVGMELATVPHVAASEPIEAPPQQSVPLQLRHVYPAGCRNQQQADWEPRVEAVGGRLQGKTPGPREPGVCRLQPPIQLCYTWEPDGVERQAGGCRL